jgi:broad specificity phosphatase PhoE
MNSTFRRIYLVRHGRPTATFAEAEDAGLDALGVAQAQAAAGRLAPLGPLTIVSSPLRRTRETAVPLERRWRRVARIEPRVAEIPSPGLGLAARGAWLGKVLVSSWPNLDPALHQWREDVVEALLRIEAPAVIFTHYVAINAAVGHATGDPRVVCFSPNHCSITVLESDGVTLRLVERGEQPETSVR